MADVKWIKLSTAMFDDEKIKLIEHLPESDTILVIWIKLLSQAGKTNSSGYIYLSENIPYTDEMLATVFNRPLSIVRLALKTLRDFGMIEIDEDKYINIANWEKHQNIDGLAKIREQTRKRVAKHREKKHLDAPGKKSNVTVTEGNATELELDLELELEQELEKEKTVVEKLDNHTSTIIEYLNEVLGTKYKPSTAKTKSLINTRIEEGFTVEDFKEVIDKKSMEWGNDNVMKRHLVPNTLFSNKFEGYLNQVIATPSNQKPSKSQSNKENIEQIRRELGHSEQRRSVEDVGVDTKRLS